MIENIQNGWYLIKASINIFIKHPKFIIPLLITWVLYAPVILYLKYSFDDSLYDNFQITIILISVIFFFAFLLAMSCSILLELVQQLETGQNLSLLKALSDTFSKNILKILPIVVIWTVIWFILLLIQALLSKRKNSGSSNEEFNAENAAKTLAGYGNFSFSKAFFKALEKGVRMIVFLILPAIAWENLNFFSAIKKGVYIFKTNTTAFVTGYVLTDAASGIIFFPPLILFILSSYTDIKFPQWVWYLIIVYLAMGWSYTIYLEQMFTSQLYLWYMKWEKEVKVASIENRPIPNINEVHKPYLLDENKDLAL